MYDFYYFKIDQHSIKSFNIYNLKKIYNKYFIYKQKTYI